jgi:sugar phosphate isomerase/epimerase
MQVGPFQVTYCTNVHPGETLDDLQRVLQNEVSSVSSHHAVRPFGAGLRLGNSVVEALLDTPEKRRALIETCRQNQYSIFTVNGFPYGNFDDGIIKEEVYEPGWHDPERLRYTLDLARLLVSLPGPKCRTISTVAGGFGPSTQAPAVRQTIAENLITTAQALAELAAETGVFVRLCLEPEPWTTLETTDDVIAFWDEYLQAPEHIISTHLGICYDCCHQAVHFENPAESIARLNEAGIHIGKIQVSSALHLADPSNPAAREALQQFAEPRFLHQVVAQTESGLLKSLDLPHLKHVDEKWSSASAWRCHFHVPIWWTGSGHLSTTKDDWQAAITAAKGLKDPPHLEIETYTWAVIPEAERLAMTNGHLMDSILAEYTALMQILETKE